MAVFTIGGNANDADATHTIQAVGVDGGDEINGIGSRFGTAGDLYEICEELGSGAAARVYACRQLRTGERFAVKIINLQRMRLMGDFESHVIKLNREVEILRELHHPKIVNMIKVHKTRSSVFLIMELVSGGELFDQIVQNKSFNEIEAKYIFRQLLEGIAYMHSRHVIHRDLKPENILVASSRPAPPPASGKFRDVKIADFGLSKVVSDGTSFAKTFVGTPQYWAPEVLDVQRGGGSYTQAADFWSLGAVLFVMLCGRYPFDGKKMPLEVQIQTAAFNMNTTAWQSISSEAKDIVSGLLKVRPTERMGLEDCLRHPWVIGSGSFSPHMPPISLGPQPNLMLTEAPSNAAKIGEVVPVVTEPKTMSDTSARTTSADGDASNERDGKRNAHGGSPTVPSIQVSGGGGVGMTKPELIHDQETIFCLNELLKLQVSIASSLEMACLAFRHADMELSDAIRKTFRQARDLSQHATNVVSQYAQVAQQVSQTVLPDLRLAVQEKEPSLAVSLLAMMKGWVTNMRTDGEDIQSRYMALQDSVHSLIRRAQLTKTDADRRLAEAVQAEIGMPPMSPRSQQYLALVPAGGTGHARAGQGSTSDLSPSTGERERANTVDTDDAAVTAAMGTATGGSSQYSGMPTSHTPAIPSTDMLTGAALGKTSNMSVPLSMNNWTRHLFDKLSQLQDGNAVGEGATGNTTERAAMRMREAEEAEAGISEAWKRDVLELLFMAPGIMPSQLPPPRLESMNTPAADVPARGEKTGGGDCSTAMADASSEVAVVLHVPPNQNAKAAAEAMTHSSASLLRALRELKRVDEILHGCSAFWANMDGTVQKLAQMKEHTECLVKFAGNSKPLKERFEQRLSEYTSFWCSLERLCRQYCVDHQASSKRMYEMIREVSDAADVIDTAQTARMCMMLRDTQRRQGFAVE